MKKEPSRLRLLSEEERQKGIDELIGFFQSERGEEIGIIAAGEILDHFEDTLGMQIFNKGIDQARDLVKQQLEETDYRLDELKRS